MSKNESFNEKTKVFVKEQNTPEEAKPWGEFLEENRPFISDDMENHLKNGLRQDGFAIYQIGTYKATVQIAPKPKE